MIDTQQLSRWLQGYDHPEGVVDEEPYAWLLRRLPTGEERDSEETKLAAAAAQLLREEPDVNRPGR